ncbi:MAG: hypothetical protein WC314_19915 [Vulcanimicrobiota bacterium]
MSGLANWLKLYKPSVQAVDFSTENIGGAISENEANQNMIGEIFFEMPSLAADGGVNTQIAKLFALNTHETEDLTNGKIYLPNAMDDWGANDQTAAAAGHASGDDDDKFIRFLGHDTNGDPIALEVSLSGDTVVATSNSMTALQSVEARDDTSGELTATAHPVKVLRGGATELGFVPGGYYTATSEFDLWLPATLNDTTTAADAATDPSGASWSRPRTLSTAVAIANSGVLTAGAAQGVWQRWQLPERTKPRWDLQVLIAVAGSSFLS